MLLETAETTLMASSKFIIYQPETLTGHLNMAKSIAIVFNDHIALGGRGKETRL